MLAKMNVPTELQCKYAYKACTNVRSLKKDGDHHTLCDYHRNKANSIQRTYATKRRQEKREQRKQAALRKLQTTKTTTTPVLPMTMSLLNLLETASFDAYVVEDDDLLLMEPLEDASSVLSQEEYEFLADIF
ncbi:hypothetical protein SPRG_15012 [Saprolegnia parasitica CBS 223.65]|uniref:Uncharacterized protein n=1 Tax=Saprolegnia parasitica (strain CBS 223.65) TaxID=695850 RepID=A0A067BLG8_SAPPC|nr:hypothetical protein SPRG_15012 [Saprolegnia parasitica CBS 223.65]KDO19058.1 hypothetical protein SPRG_15012 [Saprolegnia parasitica CBS 223.65]|eukprot:XP_012210246.1 hypothetical protein SPRG_15012 [Saprolegnia parasitica CBS 223.65]